MSNHLRAANQQARINAQSITQQAQHNDRAKAKAAASTKRHAYARAAIIFIAASVLYIV
jgi:hypothetical protein